MENDKQLSFNSIINYKCEKCNDTGYVPDERYPNSVVRCSCQRIKKIRKNLMESGLIEDFKRATFENFKVNSTVDKSILEKAQLFLNYCKNDKRDSSNMRYWFYLGGQSGAGKSFTNTAISGQLILMGYDYAYCQYAEVIPKLEREMASYKVDIKEAAEDLYEYYCKVEVLYIDDFLKVNKGLSLIWNIINVRYSNPRLITMISSEYYNEDIDTLEGSESLGSRIYQRCGGDLFRLNIPRKQENNKRIK